MPAAGFGPVHAGCAGGCDGEGLISIDGVGGFGVPDGAPALGVSAGGVHAPLRHVQPAPGCTPGQLPAPAPAATEVVPGEPDAPVPVVDGTITQAPF